MLQLSFKSRRLGARPGAAAADATLLDLMPGEAGVLDRLELPEADARRLMELGFIPGSPVVAALSAPGGDPRIFQVDGSEVALRRETAVCLKLRGSNDGPRP